jgi:hypothetical protein
MPIIEPESCSRVSSLMGWLKELFPPKLWASQGHVQGGIIHIVFEQYKFGVRTMAKVCKQRRINSIFHSSVREWRGKNRRYLTTANVEFENLAHPTTGYLSCSFFSNPSLNMDL